MNKINSHFILPTTNIKSLVDRVERYLGGQDEIIELKGFPVRIYCYKKPEYIAQTYKSQPVATTKYPAIMPRVKWTMQAGAYIKSGGDEWQRRRQQVQPAFHPNQIGLQTVLLPQILKNYMPKWTEHARRGEEFDLFQDLRLIITDFNYRWLFSEVLSPVDLAELEYATLYVDKNFVNPVPLWWPTPGTLRFKKSVRKIMGSFSCIIEKREKDLATNRQDILQHLMGIPLKGEDLIGELASIYFGSSVMSTTLAWIFYLVGQDQRIMQKLSDEAKNQFDPTQLDRTTLGKLEFSQAIVKEALRLFPPSFGYPRYAQNEFTLGEYKIPARSLLIPMVYLTQRDCAFWDEPLKFKPERFMAGAAPVVANSYLPFGLGPRACLGAAVAPYIMQTCLLLVAKGFRFEHKPLYKNDPEPEFGFEIHPRSSVNMRFSAL